MFRPIEKDAFAWNVPDAEFGEIMVGHVLVGDNGYVIIDPPMMPGLVDSLRVFGDCLAVIILTPTHKRGGSIAAVQLSAPHYFPGFASESYPAHIEVPGKVFYNPGDLLPLNLKVMEIQTGGPVFGDHPMHEMALMDETGRAFFADICHGSGREKLEIGPEGVIPGHTDEQISNGLEALAKAVPPTAVTGFFGHGDDLVGNFGKLLSDRMKKFGYK